jgi:hypothetical protein
MAQGRPVITRCTTRSAGVSGSGSDDTDSRSGIGGASPRWRSGTAGTIGAEGLSRDGAPGQALVSRSPASTSSTSPVVLAAPAPSHQAASATSSGAITASSAARDL